MQIWQIWQIRPRAFVTKKRRKSTTEIVSCHTTQKAQAPGERGGGPRRATPLGSLSSCVPLTCMHLSTVCSEKFPFFIKHDLSMQIHYFSWQSPEESNPFQFRGQTGPAKLLGQRVSCGAVCSCDMWSRWSSEKRRAIGLPSARSAGNDIKPICVFCKPRGQMSGIIISFSDCWCPNLGLNRAGGAARTTAARCMSHPQSITTDSPTVTPGEQTGGPPPNSV